MIGAKSLCAIDLNLLVDFESLRERERCRVQYRAVLIAGGTLVTFPRGLETRDSREVVCVLGMQSSFCCRTLVLVL